MGGSFSLCQIGKQHGKKICALEKLQGAFVVGYFLEVAVLKLITTKHNIFRMPKHLAHVD